MVMNLPASAGHTRDVSLIPGLGRSPGVGNGNPLQHSGLENSVDRILAVTESGTTKQLSTYTHTLPGT